MARASSTRYPMLDAWRGAACLLVVIYHSTFYAQADARVACGDMTWAERAIAATAWFWVGVPLFFVISGYCISASADATRRKGIPTRIYFWRRFRRIYPPYWACLAISALVVALAECQWPGLFADDNHPIAAPWSLSLVNLIGNVTLTESWLFHVLGGPRLYLLGHAWTLCYEEQFYAIVGLGLLAAPRHFYKWIIAVSLPVVLIALLRPTGGGFFFDGQWILFAAGIAVYYDVNFAVRRERWALRGLLVIGLFWSLAAPDKLLAAEANAQQSRFIAFTFALMLVLLHRHSGQIDATRWIRPFSWCGSICYSLYLVHWPIVKCVSHAAARLGFTSAGATCGIVVPLCLLVSLLAGWAFHLGVEKRFLNPPIPQWGPALPQ